MANRRDLKKDIKFVAGELIMEALGIAQGVPEKESEELANIVSEITEMYNDLIIRANHIEGKDSKSIAKGIVEELLKKSDEFYSRIAKYAEA